MMPPSRITGISIGSAAARRRVAETGKVERGRRNPTRAEEIAIDHQAEADHQSRHDAAEKQPGDRDVADRAVDHRHDARRHQIGDGRGGRDQGRDERRRVALAAIGLAIVRLSTATSAEDEPDMPEKNMLNTVVTWARPPRMWPTSAWTVRRCG